MERRDDPVLRQAFNVLQLMPSNPKEALEILFVVKEVILAAGAYYEPPVVH